MKNAKGISQGVEGGEKRKPIKGGKQWESDMAIWFTVTSDAVIR